MEPDITSQQDDGYVYEFAAATAVDEVMAFVREQWKPGHILGLDRPFFEYEFLRGDRLNIALARHRATGAIAAMEGFIPASESADADVSLVMWKTKKGAENPFLGVNVMKFLATEGGFRRLSSCGINKRTVPIYHYLGYRTGTLKHFYLLNRHLTRHAIAVVGAATPAPRRPEALQVPLQRLETFAAFERLFDWRRYRERVQFKDGWYVNRRYFAHPIYRYAAWALGAGTEAQAVIVTREVSHDGAKALRIVDFFGDEAAWPGAADGIRRLMEEGGYEYVDFYQDGISDGVLMAAGFTLRGPEDANVIPNYFEPFVRENVDIAFATSTSAPTHFFKADGDQDRPSARPPVDESSALA